VVEWRRKGEGDSLFTEQRNISCLDAALCKNSLSRAGVERKGGFERTMKGWVIGPLSVDMRT